MSSLDEELQSFAGQSAGPGYRAPDPVNQPMIRHWVEAMGDTNPVYVDDEGARAAGFPGVIAPPTMLQAWVMRGLRATQRFEAARARGAATGDAVAGDPEPGDTGASPNDRIMALLDAAGFTSVVATNCDQHYVRPLVLGDCLEVSSVIESVSPEKSTGLGAGYFVTTRMDFTDQAGETVATMIFRILKFRPSGRADPGDGAEHGERPRRPRPSLTDDNRFFFDGAKDGKLLIQRCTGCGTLRHPPRPACAVCRSFEWDTVQASGRGTVYSFVVNHHPQVPAFDYPLVVALIELEEGTRLIANVGGIEPGSVAIGTPVVARFEAFDDELTLPVFYPAVTEQGHTEHGLTEQGHHKQESA